MMKLIFQFIFLLATFTPCVMIAQVDSLDVDGPIDSEISPENNSENIFTIFSGKPGKASLYSLVLPGAGQLYNKRWWKVPLVYALEGTAVYMLIQNRNTYKNFDNCYRSIIQEETNPIFCQNITSANDAFRIRNSARSNMEISWLFLIGAHVLQTLEAFIDRHLIDFDTDENLSFSRPRNYDANLANTHQVNDIPIISLTYSFGR